MKPQRLLIVVLAAALLAVGCSKEEAGKPEAKAAASASASASTAAAAPSAVPSASAAASLDAGAAAVVASSLPGPEKADRKARRQITAANYKAELDKLDHEIGNP